MRKENPEKIVNAIFSGFFDGGKGSEGTEVAEGSERLFRTETVAMLPVIRRLIGS